MKNIYQLNQKAEQQGIALFTVLIMVLLSLLLVLGASRTAFFNEAITGNDSDYQRALEAAQIMLKDAELDIAGFKEDGSLCNAAVGYIGCRTEASKIYFPLNVSDFLILSDTLIVGNPPCQNGVCINLCPSATAGFCVDNVPRFWNTSAMLATMTPLAATYGQYTLASPGVAGNKILTATSPRKAWYWIEVIPYAEFYIGKTAISPNDKAAPYIYRITAVAQGNKAGTQAVVQTLVSLRKPS